MSLAIFGMIMNDKTSEKQFLIGKQEILMIAISIAHVHGSQEKHLSMINNWYKKVMDTKSIEFYYSWPLE